MTNISKIKKQMKDKPEGQKLYHFFYGDRRALSKKQIKEVKKIVIKDHEETIEMLDEALAK